MAATHLAATLRVVASHLKVRHTTAEIAHDVVKEAAYAMAIVAAGPETRTLVQRLEKATGVSIAELAIYAENWT